MTYHFGSKLVGVTGLGDAAADAVKKCGTQLKDSDLESKAGREKSVTTASECAADAICAFYSKGNIPPGVCGPIGGAVAKEVIKVWNSVFGDDSAQREALRKQKESAAYFAQLANVIETDKAMGAARLKLVAALIGLHDQLIPGRKGELGNMSAYRWSGTGWERESTSKPIIGTGELSMLKLLAEEGMAHRMTPQGWINIPDAFYLGAMQGQVTSLASQERSKMLAACAKNSTVWTRQLCESQVPSQRALETKILGSFAAENAAKFLDSLDKAALKARASIAARAAAERAKTRASMPPGAPILTLTAASPGKGGTAQRQKALAAVAALAVVGGAGWWWWKRRR